MNEDTSITGKAAENEISTKEKMRSANSYHPLQIFTGQVSWRMRNHGPYNPFISSERERERVTSATQAEILFESPQECNKSMR